MTSNAKGINLVSYRVKPIDNDNAK